MKEEEYKEYRSMLEKILVRLIYSMDKELYELHIDYLSRKLIKLFKIQNK